MPSQFCLHISTTFTIQYTRWFIVTNTCRPKTTGSEDNVTILVNIVKPVVWTVGRTWTSLSLNFYARWSIYRSCIFLVVIQINAKDHDRFVCFGFGPVVFYFLFSLSNLLFSVFDDVGRSTMIAWFMSFMMIITLKNWNVASEPH